MTERFLSEHQFKKYNADAPNVNLKRNYKAKLYLRTDQWRVGSNLEALRRLIPVGTNALRSELNLLLVLLHGLAEAKV